MPIFLLDADAFICMRTLSILDTLSRCDPPMDLRMTGYIARHELSNLSALIADLQASRRPRTPTRIPPSRAATSAPNARRARSRHRGIHSCPDSWTGVRIPGRESGFSDDPALRGGA